MPTDKLNGAEAVAKSGAVGIATVTTSFGQIDLALIVLLFVAVATTRASAVVFSNEDGQITPRGILINLIHMLALTVMALGVVLIADAAGWRMSLGMILLTGGTFGWTGPKINKVMADRWIAASKALFRPYAYEERKRDD